jgi:hypothetical protein
MLARLADEYGVEPDDIFRHLVTEYEAAQTGKEVPEFKTPNNPAMREVGALKEQLAAAEQKYEELRGLVEERFSGLDQERVRASQSQQLHAAASFIQQNSTKRPFMAKSDQATMARRLVELAELAAQHEQTQGLTLDEIADKLEADVRGSIARYKDLLSPPAVVQKPPVTENKTQTPGTIAPGQLTPGSGSPQGRLSDEQRRARAFEKFKSGA